jgi:hypothetical protein
MCVHRCKLAAETKDPWIIEIYQCCNFSLNSPNIEYWKSFIRIQSHYFQSIFMLWFYSRKYRKVVGTLPNGLSQKSVAFPFDVGISSHFRIGRWTFRMRVISETERCQIVCPQQIWSGWESFWRPGRNYLREEVWLWFEINDIEHVQSLSSSLGYKKSETSRMKLIVIVDVLDENLRAFLRSHIWPRWAISLQNDRILQSHRWNRGQKMILKTTL